MRFPLLAGAAVLTLVLGYIGFTQVGEPAQESFWDRLHLSMQLFVLEGGSMDEPVPMTLDIARILAPVVAGAAAIVAIVAVFKEQVQAMYVRTFRRHAVVAGLSDKGFQIARTLHDDGRRVVAVERDRANPHVHACREHGLPVIVGDASQPDVLRAAKVGSARYFIVTCGSDAVNLRVAFGAKSVAARRKAGLLTAVVHVGDPGLWQLLSAELLARPLESRLRVAPFNLAETAARNLLKRHWPLDPPQPRLLIVGADELCDWLILHAAREWGRTRVSPEELLSITVVDADATARVAALESAHPLLCTVCSLTTNDIDVADVELRWSMFSPSEEDEAPPTFAYVTLSSEADALAAAIALRARADGAGLPVVLVVRDEEAGVANALSAGAILEGVRPFGLLSRTMTPALLGMTPHELVARATHEVYVEGQLAEGVAMGSTQSMRPFDDLHENTKESNRRYADGVSAKLAALGWTLVPAPLTELDGSARFSISPDELEVLAEKEHERWQAALEDDGWTRGVVIDPERKIHKNLKPWGELTEGDKDKDRLVVESLPEILARAGFAIKRSGGDAAARRESADALLDALRNG